MTEIEGVLGEWDDVDADGSDSPAAVVGAIAGLDLTAGAQDAVQAVLRERLEQSPPRRSTTSSTTTRSPASQSGSATTSTTTCASFSTPADRFKGCSPDKGHNA